MDESGRAELRRLRQARGLTQDELAAASGLSVRTVRHLERGGTAHHHPRTLRALADALGVDPGQLRRQLGPPSPGPARPAPPLGPDRLVGREPDLQRVTEATARAAVAVVTGPGGVGKTALCLRWAEQRTHDFPGGVLFLDLHGFDPDGTPLTPGDGLRSLLVDLGEPADGLPDDPDELLRRYRAVSADRTCLVVLDNARSSDQVRPLLPAGRGSRTLVTSRRRLDGLVAGDAARLVGLGPLSRDDAVRLLRERGSDAAPAERLRALARACGHLPLALVIVAAQLGRNASRVLDSSWEVSGPTALDLLEVEDGDRSVRRVLAATVDALPAQARAAAGLLGLWPWDEIDRHAAAALLGISPAEATRLLDSLADLHLVEERAPGRYARHDLVGAHFGERAADLPPGERAAALRRVYRYHLALLRCYARILMPRRGTLPVDADDEAALPDLHTPKDVADRHAVGQGALIAVIRLAQREEAAPYSWQLAYGASQVFERRGPRSAWVETTERALALVPDGDPFRPRLFNLLATAHGMSGRLTLCREYLQQALRLVPPGSESYAGYRTNVANVDVQLGDLDAAMAGYADALQVRRALGDRLPVAYTLANVGWLRSSVGDVDRARVDLEEALAIGEAEGDQGVTGICLLELGVLATAAGDPAEALDLLRRAADRARANADDPLAAEVAQRTAELLPAGSAEATEHLRTAYRLYAAVGDPRADAIAAEHPGIAGDRAPV